MLGTLELTQSLPADATLSVFYDIGQVVPQAQPLASTTVHRYVLQGSGLQVQGRYFQLQYALTWAKGHRGYKGWLPSNIESEPNNRRVNLSVSYAF
jgi:hemolysin activation/secretion protein